MSLMTSQSPTMADVARLAGCSTATVSRVLNGNDSVDPVLAERVRQAIAESNYVPNVAGRALRTARSDLWAILVPDVRNPFFTAVMESFESEASRLGFAVVLCNTKESLAREKDYVNHMIAQRAAGVVMAATSVERSQVQQLTASGIPVVLFDRKIKGFGGDTVFIDNVMVGQLAAEHLLEQGVHHPLIVAGPSTVSSTGDRETGFRTAYEQAGTPIPAGSTLHLDLRAQDVTARLTQALQRHQRTDGIFTANGPLTAAAFTILRDSDCRMPTDLCLVGVDDDQWTRLVTPTVSVVSQPVEALGRWAAQLLVSRSENPDGVPARITLQPSLLVRESSDRTGGGSGGIAGKVDESGEGGGVGEGRPTA